MPGAVQQAVWVPQMRHQSRKAAETSSGPLSMCRCRRAPASDEVLNGGDDAVGSMRRAALMARASRVNSSTTLSSLMRRKSAVSSNWKSSAHTSWALGAQPGGGAVGEPVALRLPLQGVAALVAPQVPCALGVGDQALTTGHGMGLTPPQPRLGAREVPQVLTQADLRGA